MAQTRTGQRRLAQPTDTQLLRLAARRLDAAGIPVKLTAGKIWMKYSETVDLLTINFKDASRPTRTEMDGGGSIIYNYEGKDLVSVEILDITDKFTKHVA